MVSWAAGLFVQPAPGPVLANYGLENLRFIPPVPAGDKVRVTLEKAVYAVSNFGQAPAAE